MLAAEGGIDETMEVVVKRWRKRGEVRVGEIASTEFVFKRKELHAIGSVSGCGVVEREEERVVIRHPEEARSLDAVAHGHAVGYHRCDVGLVENPRGVVSTLASFHCGARCGKFGGAGGVEWRG